AIKTQAKLGIALTLHQFVHSMFQDKMREHHDANDQTVIVNVWQVVCIWAEIANHGEIVNNDCLYSQPQDTKLSAGKLTRQHRAPTEQPNKVKKR
ncbi:hypothetical protein, partial [Zhongshania sp.]|uniref:hypothetical protein n=1 Tax=Zhongshania sp. TaxID=1971902 RepID=UPI003565C6C7